MSHISKSSTSLITTNETIMLWEEYPTAEACAPAAFTDLKETINERRPLK